MPYKSRPAIDRLLERVAHEDHGYSSKCWAFQGSLTGNKYGQTQQEGSNKRVGNHRLTYLTFVSSIEEGLVIDHLCEVRHCCNPMHLVTTTIRKNVLRGTGPSALNAKKTHCHKGHEFNEENTNKQLDGSRECRTCRRAQQKKYIENNRERIAARQRAYYKRKKSKK